MSACRKSGGLQPRRHRLGGLQRVAARRWCRSRPARDRCRGTPAAAATALSRRLRCRSVSKRDDHHGTGEQSIELATWHGIASLAGQPDCAAASRAGTPLSRLVAGSRRPSMTMTRRGLLNAMARLGGAGAAYETLVLFDFLKPPPAMAAGLALPSDAGRGTHRRDPGRRRRGAQRRLRARPRRLRRRDPGSVAPHRRAQPDAAPRRRPEGDAHRRRRCASSTTGCGSMSGRGASRITTSTSSTTAGSSASRCSRIFSRAGPTACTPAMSATAAPGRCARRCTICRATSPSCSASA